ncbi:DUF1501 domain-containing protein [Aestuariispira ectoiniformans]|uniref:DUF1501 domain-containing protein n=1 Tax=Aestuariispira ectoiniformans TaxID=2775080 RepID=UPI00223A7A92|nr:DUF1501 domain-containing protein [Aestuariispira ectoiniformans]
MSMISNAPSRRQFLKTAAAGIATASLPWGNLALAKASTNKRLVVILLHGGLDGLSLFPPYGDKQYRPMRGPLAIEELIELNNFYGLHPAADALLPFWVRKELLVFPATATPYRGSNHKQARDILATGAATPDALDSGWLNRALQAMDGSKGLAVQQDTPMILRGDADTEIWQKERLQPIAGLQERLGFINEKDAFLAHALALSQRQQKEDADMHPDAANGAMENSLTSFEDAAVARYVGRRLAAKDGDRIAVMESSGWDMYRNQGADQGRQARRFAALASTLESLATEMSQVWNDTVVVVTSEFGRTIRPNGWNGTDNGGATATLVLGGRVKGGRFLGKWPGLTTGQQLTPTIDTRSVFKAVLAAQMNIGTKTLDNTVFPGSAKLPAVSGIIR